jgi:hypothetical protein
VTNLVRLAPVKYWCPRCNEEKRSPTGDTPRGWGELTYQLQDMRGGLCEVCAPIVAKMLADLEPGR